MVISFGVFFILKHIPYAFKKQVCNSSKCVPASHAKAQCTIIKCKFMIINDLQVSVNCRKVENLFVLVVPKHFPWESPLKLKQSEMYFHEKSTFCQNCLQRFQIQLTFYTRYKKLHRGKL